MVHSHWEGAVVHSWNSFFYHPTQQTKFQLEQNVLLKEFAVYLKRNIVERTSYIHGHTEINTKI
jgi:hypothetical protein